MGEPMDSPAPSVPLEQLLAHRAWVRRVALSLARDGHEADDLEQGMWVEALERPPRSGRSLRGWLARTLRNDLLDGRRAEESRRRREEGRARGEAVPAAEEMVARAEAHRRVVEAVMALPEPYRSTVLWRFFEDVNPAVLARRLGIPVETVRTRLKRALSMLRERLGGGEGRKSDGGRWLALLLAPAPASETCPPPSPAALPPSPLPSPLLLGGGHNGHNGVAAPALVLVLPGTRWVMAGGAPPPAPPAGVPMAAAPRPAVVTEPDPAPPAVPATREDPPSPPPPLPLPPPGEGPADTDRVTGRVLAEDGTPIGGATVFCLGTRVVDMILPTGERVPTPERDEASATTAADGSFFLDGVRRDVSHTIGASAPLYGRVLLDFDPAPGAPGLVDLGEIRLPFGRALEGIALDGNGEGIPGARVRARNTAGERGRLRPGRPTVSNATSFLTEEAPTDGNGRFRFEGLAPGDYELRLEGNGIPPVEERVTVPRNRDLAGVRLRVAEGASLTFLLVDEHGVPVAGEQVRVWGKGAPRDGSGMAFSDGEGRAILRGLPRTDLTFQVARRVLPDRDPPYAPEECGPLVPAGQEVRVVLHPFASITGTVVDGKGTPLHHMQVGVYEGGRWLNSLSAFSDERGNFRVDFAAGRPVELRVERFQGEGKRGAYGEPVKRYRGTMGPLEAPADGVVLRCAEAAADRSLKVLVLDVEGHALPGVLINHMDELGWRCEETDDRGLARFEGMVAEPAWLSFRAPGPAALPEGVLWPAPVEVVPAGQVVRMACRRGVPLEGAVRDVERGLLAGAKVFMTGPVHDVEPYRTVTDAEGRFRVYTAPGTLVEELRVLWTGPAGERFEARRRNVPAGAEPLEIVARPGS